VVGDKVAARESGVDYLAAFARYADEILENVQRQEESAKQTVFGPEYPAVARPELVSDWERLFYRALYKAGVRALPQYAVEQYLLDFAVFIGGSED